VPRSCGGYQQAAKHAAKNRFDKKDQLLEISPMALRLSGQSFAGAFDEHPLRHFPVFTAQRTCTRRAAGCNDPATCIFIQTFEHPEQSELIFSSQFHTEHAKQSDKAKSLQTLFFL
jgi:hypothetical protein